LERGYLFQTFEELDTVKDKASDTQAIRELLEGKDAKPE